MSLNIVWLLLLTIGTLPPNKSTDTVNGVGGVSGVSGVNGVSGKVCVCGIVSIKLLI